MNFRFAAFVLTQLLTAGTFIREIIWYGDRLVITCNFQESVIPERLTKSHIEEVEKQIEEASHSASSFSLCSSKFRHSAPDAPMIGCKSARFCFGLSGCSDREIEWRGLCAGLCVGLWVSCG